MSGSRYSKRSFKDFTNISKKNKLKRAEARQLIQENDVCEYLPLYTKDVNNVLAHAGEPFVLGLEFEEAKADDIGINLGKLDPIAADFVKSLRHKIAFANRKMLKSFRLKLSVEEVAA